MLHRARPASGDAGCRGGAGRGRGGRRRGARELRGAHSGGGPRGAVRPGSPRGRGDGGGQSGHSGRAASDRAGGGIRRAGGALRPLGCDQPGHPGYRPGAAAPGGGAGRDRPACAGRRRRRGPRPALPRRHDGRPHLAAAGNADHVRPEGGGLGRRPRPGAAPPASRPRRRARPAVRGRDGHSGVPRVTGSRRDRSVGRLARVAGARHPLARPPRPVHAARRRARDRGRHGWQDRARHRPARPDRSRRGGRGGGAGTRRLVDDAAETESGGGVRRPRRGRPRARPGRNDAGRDGPGTRTRPRRLASRVGYPA